MRRIPFLSAVTLVGLGALLALPIAAYAGCAPSGQPIRRFASPLLGCGGGTNPSGPSGGTNPGSPSGSSGSIQAYVVKLAEDGGNVVANGSGEFDLTGLVENSTWDTGDALVDPAAGQLGVGSSNSNAPGYGGFGGPTTFGLGDLALASSRSGDSVLLLASGGFGVTAPTLVLPEGYTSGTVFSNNATWDNATFASLGITPGTYTWTWGNAPDQSFTLETVAAVPEPGVLGMFGLGVLLVGGFVTLRRRARRTGLNAV